MKRNVFALNSIKNDYIKYLLFSYSRIFLQIIENKQFFYYYHPQYIQRKYMNNQIHNHLHNKMKIRNYIKDDLKAQQYLCSICLDVCVKPSSCAGPCKSLFCLKCISNWKNKNHICPLRCSDKSMKLNIVQDFILDFYCPFNKQKCSLPIKSVKQFNSHYQLCKEINDKQYQELSYKNEFKCNKGHPLQFYIGTYNEMMNLHCQNCQQEKSCRAVCRECSEFYCVDCRRVPYCKTSCPIGHPLAFKKIASTDYICDICDCNISLCNQGGVYQDRICNFGVCESCYKTSSNKLLCVVLQNKPEQCSKKHQLKSIKQKIGKCKLCKKQKLCSKYCQTCQQLYCLKCKVPRISKDNKCLKDHQFEKILIINQAQQPILCMKCQKNTNNHYYLDKQCNVCLCEACLNYSQSLLSEQNRFKQSYFCSKSIHSMKYYSGKHFFYQCFKCSQKKPIKIFCQYCNEFYCSACIIPSDDNQCYFGHELKYGPIQLCTSCVKIQPQMQGWKCNYGCKYEICELCKKDLESRIAKKNQEMIAT